MMVQDAKKCWRRRACGIAVCVAGATLASSARAEGGEFEPYDDEPIEAAYQQEQDGSRGIHEDGQDFESNEPLSADPWAEHRYIDRYAQVEYDPYRDPTAFEDEDDFSSMRARAEFTKDMRPAGDGWDYGWYFDPIDDQWRYGWHNDSARRTMPTRAHTKRTTATWYDDDDRRLASASDQIRITGYINKLDVQGDKESGRVIAEIETHDEETVRVDLGPRKSVDRLNLDEGARVTVLTSRAAIRGGSLVAADRIITEGQTLLVDRGGAAFGTSGSRQVRGEIKDIEVRNIMGSPYYVARMETKDDEEMTVVLGARRDFANVRIDEGDEILLVGAPRYLEGRQMFVAQRVQTPDNMVVRVYIPEERFDSTKRYQRGFEDQNTYDRYPDRYADRTFDRYDQNRFHSGQRASYGRQQQQRISGEISSVRTRGHHGHQHLIALIRADNGNLIEADLGPRDNLRQLNLDRGDYINLFGTYSTEAGRTLFLAHRLTADGENVFIEVDDSSMGRGLQRQVRPVSGEITSVHSQTLRGYAQAQLVVCIETDDGEETKVILGPVSQLTDLQFDAGDRIRLVAAPGDDPEFMTAREIHTGGRVITVRDSK